MRVKNLISFYNIQRFFSIFYQTKYDKSLIDRKFSRFLYLLCRDSEERRELRKINMAFI